MSAEELFVAKVGRRPASLSVGGAGLLMMFSSLFTQLDLFGPQAIAPVLARAFETTSAPMGIAINAVAVGMAGAGLLSAVFGERLDRRVVIVGALFLLALPTALLALAPNLAVFGVLRAIQGVLMCASLTLSMAYISEEWGPSGSAPSIMAAFITGNVASNLLGRVFAGAVVQFAEWQQFFLLLSIVNLFGAIALYKLLPESRNFEPAKNFGDFSYILNHFQNSRLLGAFIIGFLILFTFVGVFTYVNFCLAEPPYSLSPAAIGLVYFVFIFSLLATPGAGMVIRLGGHRKALVLGAMTALVGILLTLAEQLPLLLLGLVLTACGLFFSQAVATGFTCTTAAQAKAAASGSNLTLGARV